LNRCDHIVMGSGAQQAAWTERFGIDKTRCSVIYNGVDTAHFDPAPFAGQKHDLREAHGIPADAVVTVAVGRLRPEKAQIDLVHALALLGRENSARLHAVLVGDGPERGRIEAAASAADIHDRIHLIGAVDDVRPYLAMADLYVLPSLTETFSNAALEAGAMDLPVVMGNVGGAMEMFPPERGGILFEAGDSEALAAALLEGIEQCRPDTRPAAGLRREVLSRFSIETMDSAWQACIFDGRIP
jgi:glycosyltransferase involved in cell wall biosynthesis